MLQDLFCKIIKFCEAKAKISFPNLFSVRTIPSVITRIKPVTSAWDVHAYNKHM